MEKYKALAEQLKRKYSKGPDSGIFTDGGASPNPGPGGWGFVYVDNNEFINCKSGSDKETTNNRMELSALINAVKFIGENKIEDLTIYSDSQLCINTINQWAKGWEKNNWKRKTGPIKNLELVKELYYSFHELKNIKLQWVPAHSGWLWNEFVDSIANFTE
ncbi:UNVERIFIED_CONTAM: hypothetical protein GTU68_019366 [Idotea baltica]|nr:hypothetical protein [Idotea baltica]